MTAQQSSLNADLPWRIHQGHVIEFHNGILETAQKPLPKPQPAPKKRIEPKPVAAVQEAPVSGEAATAPETSAPTAEEKPIVPEASALGEAATPQA